MVLHLGDACARIALCAGMATVCRSSLSLLLLQCSVMSLNRLENKSPSVLGVLGLVLVLLLLSLVVFRFFAAEVVLVVVVAVVVAVAARRQTQ